MLDLIIIGAGPAGITAAVYASRKRMDFIIISQNIGGQTTWSGNIENYTGYQFISGVELTEKFEDHLKHFDINVKLEERAVSLIKADNHIEVTTTKNNKYEAKTAIICSGKIPRILNVPGETKFKHKGITYCATCDAPLFSGKDVAVIGGGNSGLDAVLQLTKIARRIYLIEITSQIIADPVMVSKAQEYENFYIYTDTKVESIHGEDFVKSIMINHKGEKKVLPVQGVFVECGSIPVSDFAKDVERNGYKEIIVNNRCETNIPGVFASGDVTNVSAKQIIVACGEGCKATLAAFEYLNTMQ